MHPRVALVPIRISIRALREEGDGREETRCLFPPISIRALREEGDVGAHGLERALRISIRALREEGDIAPSSPGEGVRDFNPRPP